MIGPNGAGKTTLLGAVMGLLPARGDVTYWASRAAMLSVEQRVARGLILVPERRELFAAMSVADNLELGAFQRARAGDNRDGSAHSTRSTSVFRGSRNGATSSRARCRAASGRCSPGTCADGAGPGC